MSVPACDCFFKEGAAKNRVPLLPSPRPAPEPVSIETTGLREWIIRRESPIDVPHPQTKRMAGGIGGVIHVGPPLNISKEQILLENLLAAGG